MGASVQSQRGGDVDFSLSKKEFVMIYQKSQPAETGN
jgi:hypothetical protein